METSASGRGPARSLQIKNATVMLGPQTDYHRIFRENSPNSKRTNGLCIQVCRTPVDRTKSLSALRGEFANSLFNVSSAVVGNPDDHPGHQIVDRLPCSEPVRNASMEPSTRGRHQSYRNRSGGSSSDDSSPQGIAIGFGCADKAFIGANRAPISGGLQSGQERGVSTGPKSDYQAFHDRDVLDHRLRSHLHAPQDQSQHSDCDAGQRFGQISPRAFVCVSAWNKDPVFGVIGIQSGPW